MLMFTLLAAALAAVGLAQDDVGMEAPADAEVGFAAEETAPEEGFNYRAARMKLWQEYRTAMKQCRTVNRNHRGNRFRCYRAARRSYYGKRRALWRAAYMKRRRNSRRRSTRRVTRRSSLRARRRAAVHTYIRERRTCIRRRHDVRNCIKKAYQKYRATKGFSAEPEDEEGFSAEVEADSEEGFSAEPEAEEEDEGFSADPEAEEEEGFSADSRQAGGAGAATGFFTSQAFLALSPRNVGAQATTARAWGPPARLRLARMKRPRATERATPTTICATTSFAARHSSEAPTAQPKT